MTLLAHAFSLKGYATPRDPLSAVLGFNVKKLKGLTKFTEAVEDNGMITFGTRNEDGLTSFVIRYTDDVQERRSTFSVEPHPEAAAGQKWRVTKQHYVSSEFFGTPHIEPEISAVDDKGLLALWDDWRSKNTRDVRIRLGIQMLRARLA